MSDRKKGVIEMSGIFQTLAPALQGFSGSWTDADDTYDWTDGSDGEWTWTD